VTPRYVQILFEELGTTFSEFATARKLDVARSMLRSPRYAGWSISFAATPLLSVGGAIWAMTSGISAVAKIPAAAKSPPQAKALRFMAISLK
jgi:AraC-like DNA-binding protein